MIVYYLAKAGKPYIVAADSTATIKKVKETFNFKEINDFEAFMLGLPFTPYLMEGDYAQFRDRDKHFFKFVEIDLNLLESLLESMVIDSDVNMTEKAKNLLDSYRNIFIQKLKNKEFEEIVFSEDDKKANELLKSFIVHSITDFDTVLAKENSIIELENMYLNLNNNDRNAYLDMVHIYKNLNKRKKISDIYVRNVIADSIYRSLVENFSIEIFIDKNNNLLFDEDLKFFNSSKNSSEENVRNKLENAFRKFEVEFSSFFSPFAKEEENIKFAMFMNFISNLNFLNERKNWQIHYCKHDLYSYNEAFFSKNFPAYVVAIEESVDFPSENSMKESENEENTTEKHFLDNMSSINSIIFKLLNRLSETGKFTRIGEFFLGFSSTEKEAEKVFEKVGAIYDVKLSEEKKNIRRIDTVENELTFEEVLKAFEERKDIMIKENDQ
jgi:hypothetical protein